MIAIAPKHQRAGDDVVREHLHMVFSSFFDVDHQDLLKPEGELYEIVPLEQAIHFSIWPTLPQIGKVQPIVGIVHDKLEFLVKARTG